MLTIHVSPRTCNDCKQETKVVSTRHDKGYLVVMTECKTCGIQYELRFKN